MCPLVIQGLPYNEKADVYSFSIIMWEVITGNIPYLGLQPIQIIAAVVNQNKRPVIPSNCDEDMEEMMIKCWDGDQNSRPSFEEIVVFLESKNLCL